MTTLKADLDSYLNSSGTKRTDSLSTLAKSFTLPTLKSPFSFRHADTDPDDVELLIESENGERYRQSQIPSRCKTWVDSCLPSLSKKQRIFGFVTFLILGLFCFSFSTLYIPVIILKARKFALLFSLGSTFVMCSFSFLWGPYSHIQHLFSRERLPFTSIYFLTLGLTLYFAMGLQSTILTTMAAICQVAALMWFVISYIPGGQTGLRFFSRICGSMCKKTARSSLPL